MPAPNTRATIASRAKPNTRENIVIELTAAKDLSRFMWLSDRYRKYQRLLQQASVKQSAQFTHPEKNSYRHMLHRVIPQ